MRVCVVCARCCSTPRWFFTDTSPLAVALVFVHQSCQRKAARYREVLTLVGGGVLQLWDDGLLRLQIVSAIGIRRELAGSVA